MLNRLSLRAKVLLIVIPLFGTLILSSGIVIVREIQRYRATGTLDSALDLVGGISKFVHQAQIERAKSAMFIGKKITKEVLQQSHEATDSAKAVVQSALGQFPEEIAGPLKQVFTELEEARRVVQLDGTTPSEMAKRYIHFIASAVQIEVSASRLVALDGIENRLLGLTILESSKENLGQLRAALVAIVSADRPIGSKEVAKIQNLRTAFRVALQSPALSISKTTSSKIEEILNSQSFGEVSAIIDTVSEKASLGAFGVLADQVFAKTTSLIDQLYAANNTEWHLIDEEFAAVRKKALLLMILATSIAGGMMVISFFLAMVITRRLVEDMSQVSRSLTESVTLSAQVSTELTDSSQELSAAVTEQAESLQETVASLEEVKSMVSKTASNSEQAKTLSNEASQEAQEGMRAVTEMVTAMDEISTSNALVQSKIDESNTNLQQIIKVIQEIGSRTKVINDIVFQTKLLSFNASVEAARAGIHGKGFAVVAEEVGNLARMSGEAAKEIGALLHDGSQKVETIIAESKEQVGSIVTASKSKIDAGLVSSKKCSDFFNSIIEKISKIDETIVEIATASKEQSQGIHEISKAMNQLDTTTQSNRQATEETAKIANVLKSQSQDVASHVQTLQSIIVGQDSLGTPRTDKSFAPFKGAAESSPASRMGTPTNVIPFPNKSDARGAESVGVQRGSGGLPLAAGAESQVTEGSLPTGSDPGFEEV
jgi:methyl-accepting chemotaxis protein